MKVIIPKTIEEVHKANMDRSKIVLYKTSQDDICIFTLSPFGGGSSKTGEIRLADNWEVTEDKLPRMRIVTY